MGPPPDPSGIEPPPPFPPPARDGGDQEDHAHDDHHRDEHHDHGLPGEALERERHLRPIARSDGEPALLLACGRPGLFAVGHLDDAELVAAGHEVIAGPVRVARPVDELAAAVLPEQPQLGVHLVGVGRTIVPGVVVRERGDADAGAELRLGADGRRLP